MGLQALQWEKNGIKWMFELKVAMSQRWEKEVDFPYLEIFQVFSSKVTYNVLHPNMAFHLEFTLDQKRWNEIDLLNDILRLEPFKNSKN